ncbi:MAG: hypothetical protein IJS39_06150 [Synergistaceae bacterium]|nr:hypothetical protein [Synergistaceae bacterium]
MLITDIVLTLVFVPLMIWLFSKRLDELEDWQEDAEERLSSVEAKTKVESYEVGYLMEQAEKR